VHSWSLGGGTLSQPEIVQIAKRIGKIGAAGEGRGNVSAGLPRGAAPRVHRRSIEIIPTSQNRLLSKFLEQRVSLRRHDLQDVGSIHHEQPIPRLRPQLRRHNRTSCRSHEFERRVGRSFSVDRCRRRQALSQNSHRPRGGNHLGSGLAHGAVLPAVGHRSCVERSSPAIMPLALSSAPRRWRRRPYQVCAAAKLCSCGDKRSKLK
jgi:hypothetical protein